MVFVVSPIYQYHVYNYPPERQARDAEFILQTFGSRLIADTIVYTANLPILRAFSQYFLGLFTAMQRVDGGNTTYFLGEISSKAWTEYFPIVYLIKETLTFHILTIIAIAIFLFFSLKKRIWKDFFGYLKKYFAEFSMFLFIVIYWYTSITSNLNIGVRHLLPVFPFTIILISILISKIKFNYITTTLLSLLLLFQAYSVLSIYPHFIAYFNETINKEEKHLYAVDSNLDWGQDLRRTKKWLDENNINFVYIDYFGGGNLDYHLGEGSYKRWNKENNHEELERGNYFVASVNQLQGGRGIAVKGFTGKTDFYMWLDKYEIVKKIGDSIFVYYID